MNILSPSKIIRLSHTLRHLHWNQIFHRLKYRCDFWSHPAEIEETTIRPDWDSNFESLRDYQLSLKTLFRKQSILAGEYEFIHLKEQIRFPPNWDFDSPHKLWRYQLHYFDWIFCLDYEDAKQGVLDWMEQYPFKKERDGWEPYPTSLRLINWGIFFVAIHRAQLQKDIQFFNAICKSIQIQACWLEKRLEFHLKANHLFENVAALVITGCLFQGKDADRWLQEGEGLLNKEISEQILPDGMHYERSPMYHLRMFHVLNNAHLCLAACGQNKWEPELQSMQRALKHTLHPDKEIALFNDSSFGVYPLPDQPCDFGKSNLGFWQLPSAGYFGYRGSKGEYIIVDAGSIGPDYNPGHAHGDIFSYELSWNHRRIIVDSGNFDYEPGPMRTYCRSTRAHNTVGVNDEDQSDFWGTFRVGRRARPEGVKFAATENGFHLEGCHNGFLGHKEKSMHHRSFEFDVERGLRIQDYIHSKKPVKAVSRLHFHPDCRVMEIKEDHLVLLNGNVCSKINWDSSSDAVLEESFYCPEFNVKYANKTLALTQQGINLTIRYSITFTQA